MEYVRSILYFLLFFLVAAAAIEHIPGSFQISGRSGVPAMHAALLQNGKVVFLDKIENAGELSLPNDYIACSNTYDVETKEVKPLNVETNPFCCGGTWLADGRLITLGGNGNLSWMLPGNPAVTDGWDAIRYLDPNGDRDWQEPGNKMSSHRWYASAQTMSDGTVFVASGSLTGGDQAIFTNNNPTYEILNAQGISRGKSVPMDILVKNQPVFMYPFLHLMTDGSLFIFVAKSAQLFDTLDEKVIKDLPDLPGMYRTYVNGGGSTMLPLWRGDDWNPEIMICGGGAANSYDSATDRTCGRMKPLVKDPAWKITASMPEGRTMVEGVNLLDGTVLWVNGAKKGAEGFWMADDPAYTALVYDPAHDTFKAAGQSTIARLYHSVAVLLPDGTVLIAGSNPNEMPLMPGQLNKSDQYKRWPTEFRTEIWTPPYLQGDKAKQRPAELSLSNTKLKVGDKFTISLKPAKPLSSLDVILYTGGFITHGLHMGQQMFYLENNGWIGYPDGKVQVEARIPNAKMAPGPYWIYVVANGVPGIGQPVMVAT